MKLEDIQITQNEEEKVPVPAEDIETKYEDVLTKDENLDETTSAEELLERDERAMKTAEKENIIKGLNENKENFPDTK